MADNTPEYITKCPECDRDGPEAPDEPTKWHEVLEKLINSEFEYHPETNE